MKKCMKFPTCALTYWGEFFLILKNIIKFSVDKRLFWLFWRISSTLWIEPVLIWKVLSLTSKEWRFLRRVSDLIWEVSKFRWKYYITNHLMWFRGVVSEGGTILSDDSVRCLLGSTYLRRTMLY